MTKKCPYCAEDVQQEALVCKHCKRDIVVVAGATPHAAEFTVDIVDAKGNLKGGYLLAMAGLGLCMLWIPTHESFDGAGWLLLIGWLLVWFGTARTIKGSGIIRYAGSFLLTCVMLGVIAYVSDPTLPSEAPKATATTGTSPASTVPVVPTSLASYEDLNSEVGCDSKYSDERKDDVFRSRYRGRWMTWRGEVVLAESESASLNLDGKGTQDLAVDFADKRAGYALVKGEIITVTFIMKSVGGCILPFGGSNAVIEK